MGVIMGRGTAITGRATTPRGKFDERMAARWVRGYDDKAVRATSPQIIDLCIDTDFKGLMSSVHDFQKFSRFVDGVIDKRDVEHKIQLDTLGDNIVALKAKRESAPRIV
jgi:hypothetical protein